MSLLVLDSKTWRVGGLGSLVDNMTLAHKCDGHNYMYMYIQ